MKSAVNRGLTVIIPERGMEWDDWEGTGYLILNPETGAGEYMISGGLSGGSTSTAVTIAGICAIIAQIAMIALLSIMVGSLISAFFGAILLMQIYYIVCMLITLVSLVSMTERAGAMIDAVMQYASGNASGDEYILREFLETTIDLAELVMYMAMFDYALGKISGGTTGGTEGEGNVGSEGEAGGTGVGEGGNGGTGNGESGGNGGTGEGGIGGSGGVGTGEGTGTGGSSEGGGTEGNGGSGTGESGSGEGTGSTVGGGGGSGFIGGSDSYVPKNKTSLWGKEEYVSEADLSTIKHHLSGDMASEFNDAMIYRLEMALKDNKKINGADLDFYAHEMYESNMMRNGMNYKNAHEAAKVYYSATEFNLYHPEVIKQYPEFFNSSWFEFWGLERN